jgi:hypothetical protein
MRSSCKELARLVFSCATGRGRGKERRGDSLILVGELLVLEGPTSVEIIVGAIALPKAGACDLPLSKKEVNLAPSIVIASVDINFKKRKISAQVEIYTPVLPIKAYVMVFPLPQLIALPAEEVVAETSIGAGTKKFKDIFSNLALGCNPFDFPTMTNKERQFIEAMVGGRMCLKEVGLEVVRTLKRVLTIPLDISMKLPSPFSFN